MTRSDFVSVTIITYNSGRFIKKCLESVLDQSYALKEIIVIDNNSSDGTIDILEPFEDRCRIVYNDENIGFAAAQNQAIALSGAEWILTLNPDVLLLQGFIEALVNAGNLDSRVGTVCGKLLTMSPPFVFPKNPLSVPRVSISLRTCAILTAAVSKWITVTIAITSMFLALPPRLPFTGGK